MIHDSLTENTNRLNQFFVDIYWLTFDLKSLDQFDYRLKVSVQHYSLYFHLSLFIMFIVIVSSIVHQVSPIRILEIRYQFSAIHIKKSQKGNWIRFEKINCVVLEGYE